MNVPLFTAGVNELDSMRAWKNPTTTPPHNFKTPCNNTYYVTEGKFAQQVKKPDV